MKNPILKKGSKIGVIAPAGRIFEHELTFAKEWAEKQGFSLEIPKDLFTEFNLGYWYAGDTNHRLKITQEALNNPDLDAIWCARGGYGSVKIIDDLDFSTFLNNPKWLIGYSDITVFHNYLNNKNIPTLHAVTAKPLNTKYTEESYTSLIKVLKGENLSYTLPNNPLNIKGKAEGVLMGGNLSIIYSQLGSCTALQGEEIILFIEDWYENWYHVDRMMEALKRSGLFKKVKGMIVGSFTKMDVEEENPDFDLNFDPTANQVILEHVKELNIPVTFNFPAGHTGDNRALIMGSKVELSVNDDKTDLSFYI